MFGEPRLIEIIDGDHEGKDMPEYFLSSYVLDHLGDEIKMTLETNLSKLRRWNADHGEIPDALESGGKQPRVDLVMFKDPHLPKDKQNLFALVEFKTGYIWQSPEKGPTDRDKLLELLKGIDMCPYGVICG